MMVSATGKWRGQRASACNLSFFGGGAGGGREGLLARLWPVQLGCLYIQSILAISVLGWSERATPLGLTARCAVVLPFTAPGLISFPTQFQ